MSSCFVLFFPGIPFRNGILNCKPHCILLFLFSLLKSVTVIQLSLTFVVLTFLRVQNNYFAKYPSIWVCLLFPKMNCGYEFLAILPLKWCCVLLKALYNGVQDANMFYGWLLTFITWLRWFLLNFFTWQLLSIPLSLTNIFGGMIWDCASPSNFHLLLLAYISGPLFCSYCCFGVCLMMIVSFSLSFKSY